jgi:hypothetical protein
MKLITGTALLLVSAVVVPGIVLAGGHGVRIDNPGAICAIQHWSGLYEDPYMTMNGNSDGKYKLATFIKPGTVTTGDSVHVCSPRPLLSKIWATFDPGQLPNPASQPDDSGQPTNAALTARGAIMYEWVNEGTSPPLDFLQPPDAEVIVWTLPASTQLPDGALELELDNWCGLSPFFTGGAQVGPHASSSFNWNGISYTAACAGFTAGTSAADLLLNSSGVLIGYVDATNVLHLSSTAPGWTITGP